MKPSNKTSGKVKSDLRPQRCHEGWRLVLPEAPELGSAGFSSPCPSHRPPDPSAVAFEGLCADNK